MRRKWAHKIRYKRRHPCDYSGFKSAFNLSIGEREHSFCAEVLINLFMTSGTEHVAGAGSL